MALCSKRDGFSPRFNIGRPREYRDVNCQLTEPVNQGTFLLVHGTCPLEALLTPPWSGDIMGPDFRCTLCGWTYQLSADTCLSNASWTPIDLPQSPVHRP